jgi:hypothetical protein
VERVVGQVERGRLGGREAQAQLRVVYLAGKTRFLLPTAIAKTKTTTVLSETL